MSNDKTDASALPAEQRGGWMSFVKSIASFSGDLSKMTAPSFILSPVSLTEYPSYWGEHPEMFDAIAQAKTPEERMVAVLKWFISTLKGQYTARNTSMGSEKKPLNPILGEQFLGKWPASGEQGETTLISEQVSHHPPITAYELQNKAAGVTVEGHSGQKTSFNGRSIVVHQVGHAMLRLDLGNGNKEEYLITLPTLSIDGLWFGSPYIELTDTSYIHSSTGLLATINYSGKGYFSGKAHTYNATVVPDKTPSNLILEASGDWSGVSHVKKSSLLPAQSVFWDADKSPRKEVVVAQIQEQGPQESRKVWKTVADGIRSGNYDLASKDKSRIENEQRKLRKEHEEKGTKHQLKYFKHITSDSTYASLVGPCKGLPATQESYIRS
ncbi:Oxysterol binding protein [Malassezia psittaci]|uniref:Oxysterol binding protein n=1 Tax=Malassezia psittaci TaxID=1821823 RepID=A0AAF0F3J9_9BASI|nr:Oxysterol binding protein [Malassezia psittaci]